MATAIYMRVSSRTQKVESQRRAIERYLTANGMSKAKWYVDEGVSGVVMDRPALGRLKKAIFEGKVDTVVVYALDRIARNAVEGMVLLAGWLEKGVRLIAISMQVDFSGQVGRMIASLLLHIAEMERSTLKDRQAAGIAAAKANGKRWGGRKPGSGTKADSARVRQLRCKGLSHDEIAATLKVSTRTVFRALKRPA